MEEDSWRRNHGGGILDEGSSRMYPGGGIVERVRWRRHQGEERCAQAHRRQPGGTQEAFRRHPGGSRRHPRSTRRHARDTQEARGILKTECVSSHVPAHKVMRASTFA